MKEGDIKNLSYIDCGFCFVFFLIVGYGERDIGKVIMIRNWGLLLIVMNVNCFRRELVIVEFVGDYGFSGYFGWNFLRGCELELYNKEVFNV